MTPAASWTFLMSIIVLMVLGGALIGAEISRRQAVRVASRARAEARDANAQAGALLAAARRHQIDLSPLLDEPWGYLDDRELRQLLERHNDGDTA